MRIPIGLDWIGIGIVGTGFSKVGSRDKARIMSGTLQGDDGMIHNSGPGYTLGFG